MHIRSVVALLAGAVPAVAAGAQAASGNGFLLGQPLGSITLSGGWAHAMTGSDVYSSSTDLLTIKRGDFSSPEITADIAVNLTSRTQLVLSGGISGVDKGSEYRDFIDNNNLPIEQTTRFRRAPLTLGVKHYLTAPGRAIGRLAWIPSRAVPFVGIAAGAMWYRFRQDGDFIDFQTNNVFPSIVESSGWTPTAHAFAGGDYSLSPRLALTGEARYSWAKAGLSHDFDKQFAPIDLSGFSTTLGLSVRF